MWNHKRSLVAKTVMNTKGSAGGIIIPGVKWYYRAMVMKAAQYSAGVKLGAQIKGTK